MNAMLPTGLCEVEVMAGPLAGARLPIYPRNELSFISGLWEFWVQNAIVQQLRPGDRAWDVGAYIGYFTLLMRKQCGRGNVRASSRVRGKETTAMRLGVVFPQLEITADPVAVRDYAQAAEGMGYTHIVAYDHVVGADTRVRPGWRGPYNLESLFHEPLVLFGYLAGLTRQVEFVTGIIILPQRQTVLVGKQAAEVDVLSGGRFRLGVGIGWNEVEYQALNETFGNRGRRSEEQIEVLRALFTQESVTFHGRWHHIEAAGINPLPVQRPIPIWLGGNSEATMKRVGRLADGWLAQRLPDDTARQMLERIRQAAREAGRDPSAIGIEARVSIADSTPQEWIEQVEGWKALGATHLSVNTMNAGLSSPREHIEAIGRFKETVSPHA